MYISSSLFHLKSRLAFLESYMYCSSLILNSGYSVLIDGLLNSFGELSIILEATESYLIYYEITVQNFIAHSFERIKM